MTQPYLIVVAGPSAAGKTTLARQIAAGLRLALICKDTIKEVPFDHLGSGERAHSQQLGYAAVQCIYALAEDWLHRPDYPGRVLPVDTSDFGQVSLDRILAWLGSPHPDGCPSPD